MDIDLALFFELHDVTINLEYLDTISEMVMKYLEWSLPFDTIVIDHNKTEIEKASKKEKLFFEQKMIIALSMIDYNDL